MIICIFVVCLPVVLYLHIKSKVEQSNIGELSIMICSLTLGMIGVLTLLTYYYLDSKWLILGMLMIYLKLSLDVIYEIFLFIISAVKNIIE